MLLQCALRNDTRNMVFADWGFPLGPFRVCARILGASPLWEIDIVKRGPWGMILLGVGVSLALVGVAPLGYLLWRRSAHNWEPLSAHISLKRGQYKSPLFRTDLDDDYQIEIYSLPPHQIPLASFASFFPRRRSAGGVVGDVERSSVRLTPRSSRRGSGIFCKIR